MENSMENAFGSLTTIALGYPMVASSTPVYSISGTVSGDEVSGVTLTLSGDADDTTTSAEDGTYSFQGLCDGNYTVTPTLTDYTFAPEDSDIEIDGADVTDEDFVSAAFWTPADLLDALGWWNASDAGSITDSGGDVSAIATQDASGINLTTGDGTPRTGDTTINGKNVIDFDGVNEYMKKAAYTGVSASGDVMISIFASIDSVNNAYDSLVSLLDGGGAAFEFQLIANSYTQFDGKLDVANIGSDVVLTGGPYSGPYVFQLVFDFSGTGKYFVYVDGVKVAEETYIAKLHIVPTPTLFLFVNAIRGLALTLGGKFGEMFVTEDVTDATRANALAYLQDQWVP